MLLDGPIDLDIPITLLHGQEDLDVPVQISLDIAHQVQSTDVVIELVKSADHRFSGDEELARLAAATQRLTTKLT